MTPTARHQPFRPVALIGFGLTLLLAAPLAHSRSACSSDGQPMPTELFERFVNADCDTCWRDPATPHAPPESLALDWIVPDSQGDDAPLAAAASSDALVRLESLQRMRPSRQDHQQSAFAVWPGIALCLSRGAAVGNYVGVSVTLTVSPHPALAWPLSGWVVLAEDLPTGTEGSPVPRVLVRNVLQPFWKKAEQLLNQDSLSFSDLRAMSFPESAQPDRLRLTGWVQDARGRILAATRSAALSEDKP